MMEKWSVWIVWSVCHLILTSVREDSFKCNDEYAPELGWSKILILAFVFTIIWKLSYGIGITCTYGNSTWSTLGSLYTCTGSISIDIESRETITAVNGTHQSGWTNADVLGLTIKNRGMEYFPVNIAQFFPNIKGINFLNNSISYVNNQHLIPLPNLVDLAIRRNRITSLNSNLFSGLLMEWIAFSENNIEHVGQDFILPNTGYISFQNNPCINNLATTPDEIRALRFQLLENCPPNWLTNVNVEIESISNRTDGIEHSHSEMDGELKNLTNTVADLENRNLQLTDKVTDLQQSNVELTSEVIDLQQYNLELTNEVTELTDEVTDLQLKNSQLETKIGFLNTRAGYLEVRVAVLEGIIESKLGLNVDDAISENVN